MKKLSSNRAEWYGVVANAAAAVLLLGTFIYVLLSYSGHVAFWEGCNYWEATLSYLKQHLALGGITLYVSQFLQLFYRWRWIASLILMLPAVATFIGFERVLRGLKLSTAYTVVALVAVVVLLRLLLDKMFFLHSALYIACYYTLLAIYVWMRRKSEPMEWLAYTLIVLLSFGILPSTVVLLLFFAMALIDIVGGVKSKWQWVGKWCTAIALGVIVPFVWSASVDSRIFDWRLNLGISVMHDNFVNEVLFLYLLPIAVLLVAWLLNRRNSSYAHHIVFASGCVGFIFAIYSVLYARVESEQRWERFFSIEQACIEKDWDRLLQLSEEEKENVSELFPFTVVALAGKGALADSIFNYPISLKGPFFPKKELSNTSIAANVAFYEMCGSINQALVYEFQNSSLRLNKCDVHTLRQLARLNYLNGSPAVGDKLLNKLRLTLVNDNYVKQISATKAVATAGMVSDSLCFASGSVHENLLSIFELTGNSTALDLFLCSLLQMRDYTSFVDYFFRYYPYQSAERLPKAYEEFLVMAPYAGIALPNNNFTISKETQARFDAFLKVYTSNKDARMRNRLLMPFRNTWFFYAVNGD